MDFLEYIQNKHKTNQLADKNIHNNIILTDDVQLSLNPVKTGKNLNVCVFGGAGTGKTYNYVLPNILQANTSYVITDCDGYLLKKTGKFLEEQGYVIKVLNLNNTEHSNHYNPFDYVYDKDGFCDETAVTRMVEMILAKTSAEKTSLVSQIADDMMCVLVSAICFYLFEIESKENRNFQNVIRLLSKPVSELDEIFYMPDEKVKLLSLQRYMLFRKSAKAEEIEEAIRIEALNRLSIFTQTDITDFDDMELDLIGDRKTAVFITLSTFNHCHFLNFISGVLITQIFNVLINRTESLPNNKLPIHVRFMLDEFANCGYIPDFEKYSAVCGHHNMSVNIILQCIEQLQALYGYSDVILNNCDSNLFLGSHSIKTLEYISENIDNRMNFDELRTMNNNKCVLHIRRLPLFYGKKFDVVQHCNYGKIEN